MEQQANYIRRIEIHGLWERFNIGWDLRPDVNILSGINGVGKTTILNRSVGYLEELSGEMKSDEKNGVRLFFDNPQATYIPYDVIRSLRSAAARLRCWRCWQRPPALRSGN